MQSNIALRGKSTPLVFGSLGGIRDDELLVRAVFPWNVGDELDFRLELTMRGAWASGRLCVVDTFDTDPLSVPLARCRVCYMAPEQRSLLDDWLDEMSAGGTSTDPGRWVESTSQGSAATDKQKRAAFREALRDHVRSKKARRRLH